MAEVGYKLTKKNGDWNTDPRNREEVIQMLEELGKKNDYWEYRLFAPDADWYGPAKARPVVLTALNNQLLKGGVGDLWKLRPEKNHNVIYQVRKVRVGLEEATPTFSIAGIDIKPDLERVCRVAAGFDHGVDTAGGAYTRYIAGTTTYSQHSRRQALSCKGNAVDLYFALPYPVGNDINRQRALVKYLIAHAWELNLGMIISERTYWAREFDFAPRYYSGIAHVSHTHLQASPEQNGAVCF